MKFRLTTPVWKVCATLLGAVLLLLSFQNCGKAGFDSGLDSGLSQSSTDASLLEQFGQTDAPKVAAAPFAFDIVADQIAYNSCTSASLATTAGFFTFKVGGYTSAGGIKVRQDFLDYLTKNFKPVYPATVLSTSQIKNFLAASPENQGAHPQFAIRTRGAPQQLRTPSSSQTPVIDIDYFNLLDDLTNDRFMDPLVKAGTTPVQYFPFGIDATQRTLEAQISYNTNEDLAQNLRTDFGRGAQLALTYSSKDVGADYNARFPIGSTDVSKAYGRGFVLGFVADQAQFTRVADYADLTRSCSSVKTASNYCAVMPRTTTRCPNGDCSAYLASNNPNNILRSVAEVDLTNSASSTGATWTCDPMRRYVIVKPSDAALGLCPQEPFAALSGVGATAVSAAMTAAQYKAELAIVRRSLRSEDWDVNIALRCVVPKATGSNCYPDETISTASGMQTVGVQYDQTQECFQGSSTQSFLSATAPPTKRCAQYVSICTRNP